MKELTVINDMLATLGEAPLASLETPHQMKGAATSVLLQEGRRLQSTGWWFNREAIDLIPMLDQRIALPGDTLSIVTPTWATVQRGSYLYDVSGATYFFDAPIYGAALIRLIPFESLPESMAQYISATAVLRFQTRYDGDVQKSRELGAWVREALIGVNKDDARNTHANLIASNPRLQRIKSIVRGARFPGPFSRRT